MKDLQRCLWEILVPKYDNAGQEIPIEKHHEWDLMVQMIAGGLTIYRSAQGQWLNEMTGALYRERMVPVRIAATSEEMERIVEFTAHHYEQIQVMYYKVSNEVYFYIPKPL